MRGPSRSYDRQGKRIQAFEDSVGAPVRSYAKVRMLTWELVACAVALSGGLLVFGGRLSGEAGQVSQVRLAGHQGAIISIAPGPGSYTMATLDSAGEVNVWDGASRRVS